jgi:hypothetical protein
LKIVLLLCLVVSGLAAKKETAMAELKSPVLEGLKDQEQTYHNGNPDHYAIPALRKSGSVLMRLEFTEEERGQINLGFDVFVEILTNGGIQPIRFTVGHKSFVEDWQAEGYCEPSPEASESDSRRAGAEALARLLKSSNPDEWQELVRKYNQICVNPLPNAEIDEIIERTRKS